MTQLQKLYLEAQKQAITRLLNAPLSMQYCSVSGGYLLTNSDYSVVYIPEEYFLLDKSKLRGMNSALIDEWDNRDALCTYRYTGITSTKQGHPDVLGLEQDGVISLYVNKQLITCLKIPIEKLTFKAAASNKPIHVNFQGKQIALVCPALLTRLIVNTAAD